MQTTMSRVIQARPRAASLSALSAACWISSDGFAERRRYSAVACFASCSSRHCLKCFAASSAVRGEDEPDEMEMREQLRIGDDRPEGHGKSQTGQDRAGQRVHGFMPSSRISCRSVSVPGPLAAHADASRAPRCARAALPRYVTPPATRRPSAVSSRAGAEHSDRTGATERPRLHDAAAGIAHAAAPVFP